ncbi:MAG: MotA/TolQ/ExbB proton channel family protein [Planctomycetota bacterium]|nr:MAG: MotA/TolQ/ExbB proton channel family protein [Planctomycetota bacterium]
MYRNLINFLVIPLLLLGVMVSAGFAQDEAAANDDGVATAAAMDDVAAGTGEEAAATGGETSVIDQIRNGGIPMGFLIALAVVAILLILERFAKLTRSTIAPDHLLNQAKTQWEQEDYAGVEKLGKESPSALGKVIAFLAENREADYTALNEGAGEIAAREIQKHQQRNYWLAVVGTLSPLLGLLGTVLGMIAAFQAVAMAGDIGDVSMVADGIYKALATTAAGLIIAIPTLGFYHFLKGRTNQLALELEDAGSHLIIKWFGKSGAGKEA